MDLSMFLAKLLGLYLLIVAAELLFRRHELEGAVKDFASSKGLLVLSGSFSLLFGLAIVLSHHTHTFNASGLVTLIGYLLVLKGILRIAAPSHLQKMMVSGFQHGYWIILVVMVVVGAFLTYSGFML